MPISAVEPLLAVKDLESGYGKIRVLHGVDLSIAAGEVVALLGPNGAGKTTLLRALSGLLPALTGNRPDTALSSVVLPAPLGPSSATTSPAAMERSTPCSTRILP